VNRAILFLAAACILAVGVPVQAHRGVISGMNREKTTVSRSSWRAEGRALTGELVFLRHHLSHVAAGLPESAEVLDDLDDAALRDALASRVEVSRDGAACTPRVEEPLQPAQPGQVVARVRWRCPGGEGPVRVQLGFLSLFDPDHRHVAAVTDEIGSRTEVLARDNPVLSIAPGVTSWVSWSFLPLGIEHILLGWDHLIFLFGLILLGGTFRSLLATVTAFTVAHSITLALAALAVWSPGSAFVEPLIGATIAYVGIENLFLKEPKGRWRIAFVLGLVHGFGFAGALAEAGLAQAHLASALLLFNLGVEFGQVMVLAVLLPLVLLARRRDWVVSRAVPAASVVIALVGVVLVVTRVFG
jgi:hypothetical protein